MRSPPAVVTAVVAAARSAADASNVSAYPIAISATFTETPTATAYTANAHVGSWRTRIAKAPAASAIATATTAGRTKVRPNGFTPVVACSSATSSGYPGRSEFTWSGGWAEFASACGPCASTRLARQMYFGVS